MESVPQSVSSAEQARPATAAAAHLPTNAIEGIQQCVTNLVDAPFRALNDLVSMPVEGMQKEGIYGGVKGLTAGIVSAPKTIIGAGIESTNSGEWSCLTSFQLSLLLGYS